MPKQHAAVVVPKSTTKSKWESHFTKLSPAKHFRSILMAYGEHGTGKTRLGLTMPGPTVFQSLDSGLEGVAEQILAGRRKEAYFNEYAWDTEADDFNQEYAIEVRDKIIGDFKYAVANAPVSIVWDKETDIRAVFEYAEFGSPTGGNVKDYGKLNQRYFNLINSVKAHPRVNFLLIQSLKYKWIVKDVWNSKKGDYTAQFTQTDERIRSGFDRLPELVFVEIECIRRRGDSGTEYFYRIGKNRQNSHMQDIEIPACDFPELGTMLIEHSEPTDWDPTYTKEEE